MMKKNKYIIALLLLSNLFTGCEIGFLDNEAFSDLTREGYYEKLSDYEAALVGCYYLYPDEEPRKRVPMRQDFLYWEKLVQMSVILQRIKVPIGYTPLN